MNKYNKIEWDNEIWDFFGIEQDIRDVWDRRFGEDNVSLTLVHLREYLKTKPNYEEEVINKYCGGNWAFFIWDALERNEKWRKENEREQSLLDQ